MGGFAPGPVASRAHTPSLPSPTDNGNVGSVLTEQPKFSTSYFAKAKSPKREMRNGHVQDDLLAAMTGMEFPCSLFFLSRVRNPFMTVCITVDDS